MFNVQESEEAGEEVMFGSGRFKDGDRVVAYNFDGRHTGSVVCKETREGFWLIALDKMINGNEVLTVHEKQIRRLKKSRRRTLTVTFGFDGDNYPAFYAGQGDRFGVGEKVTFIEKRGSK